MILWLQQKKKELEKMFVCLQKKDWETLYGTVQDEHRIGWGDSSVSVNAQNTTGKTFLDIFRKLHRWLNWSKQSSKNRIQNIIKHFECTVNLIINRSVVNFYSYIWILKVLRFWTPISAYVIYSKHDICYKYHVHMSRLKRILELSFCSHIQHAGAKAKLDHL